MYLTHTICFPTCIHELNLYALSPSQAVELHIYRTLDEKNLCLHMVKALGSLGVGLYQQFVPSDFCAGLVLIFTEDNQDLNPVPPVEHLLSPSIHHRAVVLANAIGSYVSYTNALGSC